MWRIQRVNQLIKEELSKILLRGLDISEEVLVTVTRVETSTDLRHSKVFFSVLPREQTKEIQQILNYKIYDFQHQLNKRLKMRIVPKVKFIEEKKIAQAERIEEILEKINKK